MTGRQFRVDWGGTFTDVVARRPDGRLLTPKPLPDNPARHAHTGVKGVRTLLAITRGVIDALDDEYAYGTDSGAVIRVTVCVNRENPAATIDFTGTSAQHRHRNPRRRRLRPAVARPPSSRRRDR